jgi:hypothetical protein
VEVTTARAAIEQLDAADLDDAVTAVAGVTASRTLVVKAKAPGPKAVLSASAALPKSGGIPFPAGGISSFGLGIALIGSLIRHRNGPGAMNSEAQTGATASRRLDEFVDVAKADDRSS